jgi:hypothetical protein
MELNNMNVSLSNIIDDMIDKRMESVDNSSHSHIATFISKDSRHIKVSLWT